MMTSNAPVPSRLKIDDDPTRGFISAKGTGAWEAAHLDRHFIELGSKVAAMRDRWEHARVLVDLRDVPAQSFACINRIRAWNARIFRDGDRCGLVVTSSLMKLQMRRIFQDGIHNVFVSDNAARTWIMAYAHMDVRRVA